MNTNITKEFEETSSDLLSTISSFSQDDFNKIPFEGSWTAGQVSEHLFKANSGTVETLNGNTKPTDRDPAKNEKILREIFLDFSTKMKSPEFILPSDQPKDKESMVKNFEDVMNNHKTFAENEDLSLTCTDFALPNMGELTRYEWICFVIVHTKRHTHQLKNIYDKLKK
jgi:hypothetical protein